MPTITIKSLDNKSIIYTNSGQSILKILHENNIDWMHACGAKGKCTTCKMILHQGIASLSDLSSFEKECRILGKMQQNERLACQCSASEDIVISVPESSKMPHINYSV